MEISQFTRDIRHISGKNNVVADWFSRGGANPKQGTLDDSDETIIICATCYTSLAHAIRTGNPPIQTFAFYDYGVIPAHLPQLYMAEKIATSVNIVIQVILNLRPLGGISQTAAKGHAIAVPLTGVQSLATKVYELPRTDLREHIQLVVVAKKSL